MRNKLSREIRKKGYFLFSKGKVIKELETDKRIHFKVLSKDIHSVIFDKEKNIWQCDCKFSSLKEGICSHVYAAMLKEKPRK